MDHGKRIHDWEVGSWIVATILNVNRDPKKGSPVDPDDIHPMKRRKRKRLSPKESVRAIAEAWGVKPPGDESCPPLTT